ncbi:MAG: bifunctional folylpolyglutamate synthase/dihydrofolate synthase [Neisseriaceae bacterium]|nr:MAG: bifunctional folylpolyglutamate synthase/dihydrofolate synthase [Neisseriaceae bacterium]
MASLKNQLIDKLLKSNNFSNNNEIIIKLIEKLKIQPTYPIILIGGTNGKGSTCAYLTTMLTNAGYKVGTYTSPHVFEYNERIKLNNKPIDDESLSYHLQSVITASSENLGIFKTFTLATHLYFIEQKIDIAIVEVGLGGAKDTTNLFEPTISAITTVALDHCDALGDNVEQIGLEKAGIYRTNKPAFFGSRTIPNSVQEYANKITGELIQLGNGYDFKLHDHGWDFISPEISLYSMPFPSMRGSEQIYNAALAIAILGKLRNKFPLSSNQIKNGLLQTSLIGRFQVMAGTPQVIFDTAHNPQAIELMCKNMLKLGFAKTNIAVFAIAQDKDYKKILEIATQHFDKWYIAPLSTSRTSDVAELAEIIVTHGIKKNNIVISQTINEAFSNGYHGLQNNERLVSFGSFITVEQSYLTYTKIRI